MSVLGVLLLFAGSQLSLTIIDLTQRKDLFVSLFMVGVTLAVNLAVGFVVGFILAYAPEIEPFECLIHGKGALDLTNRPALLYTDWNPGPKRAKLTGGWRVRQTVRSGEPCIENIHWL